MDRVEQQFAAAKRMSPLVLGRSERGSTVASDAIALNDHADELFYLEDDQLALLSAESVCVFDRTSMRQISPVSVAQQDQHAGVDLAGYRRLPVKGSCGATGCAAAVSQRRPRRDRNAC